MFDHQMKKKIARKNHKTEQKVERGRSIVSSVSRIFSVSLSLSFSLSPSLSRISEGTVLAISL